MGMPVVDLSASYSFASKHPVLAAMVILSLIALAWFVVWMSRKLPQHMGKVRLGLFVVYLALTIPLLWATFKPHPSPLAQVYEATQALQRASESAGQ